MVTLAVPQSLPSAAHNRSASRTSVVKMLLARPWGTPFCNATASSKSSYVITYSRGAKVSVATISVCAGIVMMAGRT